MRVRKEMPVRSPSSSLLSGPARLTPRVKPWGRLTGSCTSWAGRLLPQSNRRLINIDLNILKVFTVINPGIFNGYRINKHAGKPHTIQFKVKGKSTIRSEEHTSELQSRPHLVCRLLLEKKKKNK